MKKALVSGSFDPITKGHLYVIQKASEIADEVIVVVASNPAKKHMFDFRTRVELVNTSIKDELNLKKFCVVSLPVDMLLVEYASHMGASFIVRGIRNGMDFDYENQLNLVQKRVAAIETYYVMPPRELLEVSSSLVRGVIGLKDWASILVNCVPDCVFHEILNMKR